jgi:type IX secretion system PorP/SprF family membrane protein
MNLRRHLIIAFVLLFGATLQAQDIHFSQFYLSPLNLNPAMTGVMNCNSRFTVNYRNQWQSVLKDDAFKTYNFSFDNRIAVGRSDYFGWGFTFWGDQAGASDFGTLQGRFSLAYSKKMGGFRNKAHYLVIGLEGGASQRTINFLNLRYGTQFDGDDFNPNLPSLENFGRDNFLFGDVGGGLLWYSVFDENTNFYAGAAFVHLNRANQSFYFDRFIELFPRSTFHAGGEFLIPNTRVGLVPGVVVMSQGPSFQVNAGTNVKFLLGKRRQEYQAFQIGTWFRTSRDFESGAISDAFILSTRFDFNNIAMGFSYDVNVSDLNAASNGNGGFELSLIYTVCKGFQRQNICPRF